MGSGPAEPGNALSGCPKQLCLLVWSQENSSTADKRQKTLHEHLNLPEVLLQHARSLGAWPLEAPLEGIEHDLLLAKMVNTYVEKPTENPA